MLTIGLIIVFLGTVFGAFTYGSSKDETFYLTIQVKDYTDPVEGDVIFRENETLSQVFENYNMRVNSTCVYLDIEYCNDDVYIWRLYVNNNLETSNLNYKPKDKDQIIFKYEKI